MTIKRRALGVLILFVATPLLSMEEKESLKPLSRRALGQSLSQQEDSSKLPSHELLKESFSQQLEQTQDEGCKEVYTKCLRILSCSHFSEDVSLNTIKRILTSHATTSEEETNFIKQEIFFIRDLLHDLTSSSSSTQKTEYPKSPRRRIKPKQAKSLPTLSSIQEENCPQEKEVSSIRDCFKRKKHAKQRKYAPNFSSIQEEDLP